MSEPESGSGEGVEDGRVYRGVVLGLFRDDQVVLLHVVHPKDGREVFAVSDVLHLSSDYPTRLLIQDLVLKTTTKKVSKSG